MAIEKFCILAHKNQYYLLIHQQINYDIDFIKPLIR